MIKNLKFEVLGNSFEVKPPTTKQYIDIQNMKVSLAPNYEELKYGSAESLYADTLIDAIAHLTVLCPELINSLNKKSILDLDMIQSRQLVNEYVETFRPWYTSFLNFVFEVDKKKEETKEKPVETNA